MKLTEAEMKMVFQIESTDQNAVLSELHMIRRYAQTRRRDKQQRNF